MKFSAMMAIRMVCVRHHLFTIASHIQFHCESSSWLLRHFIGQLSFLSCVASVDLQLFRPLSVPPDRKSPNVCRITSLGSYPEFLEILQLPFVDFSLHLLSLNKTARPVHQNLLLLHSRLMFLNQWWFFVDLSFPSLCLKLLNRNSKHSALQRWNLLVPMNTCRYTRRYKKNPEMMFSLTMCLWAIWS